MSYILEALQKAQAERQLGAAPTLHAPTLETGRVRAVRSGKRPLVLALVLMGAAVAGLLAMLLRAPAPATGAAVPAVAQAPASAAGPATAVQAVPPVVSVTESAATAAEGPATAPASAAGAPAAIPVGPTPAGPAQAASVPVPSAQVAATPAVPAAAAATAPAAAPLPPAEAIPAASKLVAAKAGGKAGRATGGSPEAGAKAPAPAAEAEEHAQLLRELPEPIQRAIPPIAMSGYMYSKNPADRLILIDKVLRHEGEEVAPGLVLEKLQAKGAVFSFRGYRYRVPY